MDYMEFTGKTVDEAITAACEHFLITSSKLDYEVIDNGSTGFLGFGAKPAVIKAREKAEEVVAEVPSNNAVKNEPAKEEKKVSKKPEKKPEKKDDKSEKKAKPVKKDDIKNDNQPSSTKKEERKIPVNVDEAALKADAEKFLKDVFNSMNIDVSIKSEYFPSDGELDVELSGPEMGVLIGKRGQTLDSLQYLTSLVVNKGTSSYIRVKVDTEDYRRRRRETLENLAKNLSFKVKRTRKSVSLEPMNPYERRIIHSALQGDKFVTTHSEGEEPYRRVVITPKRGDR